ncbi:MAG: hypothetical protein ABH810_00685, partial [bacterium]
MNRKSMKNRTHQMRPLKNSLKCHSKQSGCHSEQREESPMNMGSGIRQRSFVKTQDDTKKTFFNGPRIALPGLKILT